MSLDLSTEEFLRSLQLHTFEYGVPTLVLIDLGSQLVAGANIITTFLNDAQTVSYFEENKVCIPKFEQYIKGKHELGSLVESCVKISKRLFFGAIGKTVLGLRHFKFFVSQTVSLANTRPIAS